MVSRPSLAKADRRVPEHYRKGGEDTDAAVQVFRRITLTCHALAGGCAPARRRSWVYVADRGCHKDQARGTGRLFRMIFPDLKGLNLYSRVEPVILIETCDAKVAGI